MEHTKNNGIQPHYHDVLFGRGGGINKHLGNVKWRELVAADHWRYMAWAPISTPSEKKLIISSIVSAVRNRNPPGRFLQKNSKTQVWFDVGDKKAKEKTSQAFRDCQVKHACDLDDWEFDPCRIDDLIDTSGDSDDVFNMSEYERHAQETRLGPATRRDSVLSTMKKKFRKRPRASNSQARPAASSKSKTAKSKKSKRKPPTWCAASRPGTASVDGSGSVDNMVFGTAIMEDSMLDTKSSEQEQAALRMLDLDDGDIEFTCAVPVGDSVFSDTELMEARASHRFSFGSAIASIKNKMILRKGMRKYKRNTRQNAGRMHANFAQGVPQQEAKTQGIVPVDGGLESVREQPTVVEAVAYRVLDLPDYKDELLERPLSPMDMCLCEMDVRR